MYRALPLAVILLVSCKSPELTLDAGHVRTCAECDTSERCVGGRCFARDCGSTTCGTSAVCVNGACVEDSCAPISCVAGTRCLHGQCYSAWCGTKTCDEGSVCVGAACIEERCLGVTCSDGRTCKGGTCQCGGFTTALADGGCRVLGLVGDPCTSAQSCLNGLCVDGVCCNSSCDQPCNVCGANGICTVLDAGTKVPRCALGYCNGASPSCAASCRQDGECNQGAFCDNGTCSARRGGGGRCDRDSACASGFCTDGSCCDQRCDEPCAVCGILGRSKFSDDAGVTSLDAGFVWTIGACSGVPAATTPANSCGWFVCGGSRACPNLCQRHQDCTAQGYCDGGTCTALRSPGQLCGSGRECLGGNCVGGRCCSSRCDCGTCDVNGSCVGTVPADWVDAGPTCQCFDGTCYDKVCAEPCEARQPTTGTCVVVDSVPCDGGAGLRSKCSNGTCGPCCVPSNGQDCEPGTECP